MSKSIEILQDSDSENTTNSIGPTSRINEENKMNSTGTQTSFKSIVSPTVVIIKAITLPKLAKFKLKSMAPSDIDILYDLAKYYPELPN